MDSLWTEAVRIATVAVVGWTAAWFVVRQQNIIYKKIEEIRDVILGKLEYHERHDDTRFDVVQKNIYQLGLRMAANTGKFNGD